MIPTLRLRSVCIISYRGSESKWGIWESVQCRESNWKGKLSKWRIAVRRKNDRERKRREKRRKKERPLGVVARTKGNKGVAVFGMMKVTKPIHQQRKDAVRKYITQHAPGTFLTFEQRLTLAADWNELIRSGCRVTIRQFATKHGLRPETWRREYNRGATGVAVPDPKDGRRRKYAEYDPLAAQDKINESNENKGTKLLETNQIVTRQV